ncbi:MAG: DUF1559 domain-containing protein [Rubripirellula sp.]|nr:DUF1559 domain-containing protein [Rubripirellula sp.]
MKNHRSSNTRVNVFASRTGGFTLVELLVVLAIIGVLIGLLLPAVQAAREAARRLSCTNNLMQLGLAIHHHDFSLEHFPSGTTNPTGPIRDEEIGDHKSWIVEILPYIEQQVLYENLDLSKSIYAPENEKVRGIPLSIALCPSYPGFDNNTPSGTLVGQSNYAGCHHDVEAPIDADNNGVLFLNSKIRFGDIRDGSSQTILIGEVKPSPNSLGWASGTRATLRNTGTFERTEWEQDIPVPSDPLHVGGFDSFHSGGSNFVFADGSVRFLSFSTNADLMRQMGNRADGELPADTL